MTSSTDSFMNHEGPITYSSVLSNSGLKNNEVSGSIVAISYDQVGTSSLQTTYSSSSLVSNISIDFNTLTAKNSRGLITPVRWQISDFV